MNWLGDILTDAAARRRFTPWHIIISRPGVLYAAFSEYDSSSFSSLSCTVLDCSTPRLRAGDGSGAGSELAQGDQRSHRNPYRPISRLVPVADPIPANAERISRQTRLEIIRDFETQLVYSRTTFPMNAKGLRLKGDVITPNGSELSQALALWGPAIKPGDPMHISLVQIKNDHIHFEINGGPIRHQKWYRRLQISGANGPAVYAGWRRRATSQSARFLPRRLFRQVCSRDDGAAGAGGAVSGFRLQCRNKEQAYLDTVPPKVKEAIQAHRVLVGMNQEMVLHAKGRPPKRVRERDGETQYEEWIYGEAPADVDFVRFVGDEVVRVETIKISGEKIVRTEKEVILQPTDKDNDKEAKKEPEVQPASRPSLRRPGEASPAAPTPSDGNGLPVPREPRGPDDPAPPPLPSPDGPPGEFVPASCSEARVAVLSAHSVAFLRD